MDELPKSYPSLACPPHQQFYPLGVVSYLRRCCRKRSCFPYLVLAQVFFFFSGLFRLNIGMLNKRSPDLFPYVE